MEENTTTPRTEYIRIYSINGSQLVAGRDITDAIETFRLKYPTDEITSVEVPQNGSHTLYHLALIKTR